MNKATERIRLKIKDKNERAAESRALKGLPKGSPKGSASATNGKATNGNNSHDRHA